MRAGCKVQVGRHLAFSLRGVFTGFKKKKPSEAYLEPCQTPMMKFFAEVVNVFLLFPQRSSAIAVRRNPKICLFYFPYNLYCSTSSLFEADLSHI